MEFYKKRIKDIWLKAAVVGSLWGSLEIIVGSFFHNIKMPMSGTVLAITGVSLMVAFGQIWKDKGLFWRAGLISAVMKSISPSAVLLGPMTGIFLEALLFEIAVSLFGRNNFAYFIGSIAALYSVVLHKLITLLVIYGKDLVKITENLYFFLTKQLKIENLGFAEALFYFSSLYVLFGIFAASTGLIIGKKAAKLKPYYSFKNDIKYETKKNNVEPDENKYSLLLLSAHIFFIIIALVITNIYSLYAATAIISAYIVFVLIKYKRTLRYFKRPGFWIQIALFVFISSLFYDGINKDTYFSPEGIEAGLKMGLRAVMIVIGFSAISSELRNPLIKMLLYRKGFWQFYTALGSAFSVLPHLMKHSAHPKVILKNPVKALTGNILDAEHIFHKFKKSASSVKMIVITGEKHKGKTSFAEKVSSLLKQKGFTVAGFTAPGKFENGTRSEFAIKDLTSGKTMLLCKSSSGEKARSVKRFTFYEDAIKFGNDILNPDKIKNSDFVIIDEAGPLELRGKGWSNAVENILKHPEIKMICLIRKNLLYDILRRFGVTDAVIFDIEKDTPEDTVNFITKEL